MALSKKVLIFLRTTREIDWFIICRAAKCSVRGARTLRGYFTAEAYESKGLQFYERVLKPLFFNSSNNKRAPFYLYVNVSTAETLQKVLADPQKYAPNGVYIMRIHGTFVNFLDLSPAIQEDIIARLDPNSTCC